MPEKIKTTQLLAGVLTEQIVSEPGSECLTTWWGDHHGIDDLSKVEESIGPFDPEDEKWIKARLFTETFLRLHWPMVMTIAAFLLAKGQIEHGQVSRIAHSLGYVRGKAGNA